MTDLQSPFTSSLFPFVATRLAPHRNPVTCILASLDRPLAVCSQAERSEGDLVIIRPGVEHWVEINGRAKVLYFDGLQFPLTATLAARVPRELVALAIDAFASSSEFKRWTALCAATRQIADGQLVRTAAMDAGFADTAHLTRTFRAAFGTTPTLATADRR
jgi:AraC-like DNA-binding protein